MPKTGYCNGDDVLLSIGGKAVGHCTSHKVSVKTTTQERAVKPAAASALSKQGLFTQKSAKKVEVTVSFDAMVFYGETEEGYKDILAKIMSGTPVDVSCFERSETAMTGATLPDPYLTGSFIVDSLEKTAKAQEDVTYSGQLSNNGEVTLDATKLT